MRRISDAVHNTLHELFKDGRETRGDYESDEEFSGMFQRGAARGGIGSQSAFFIITEESGGEFLS